MSDAPELTPRGKGLLALIETADDGLEWLAEQHAKTCTGPVDRGRVLREHIVPLLDGLDAVATEGYVKEFARVFDTTAAAVRALAKDGETTASPAESPQGEAGISPPPPEGDDLQAELARFGQQHFKVWFGGAAYVGRETTDDDGRATVEFVTSGDVARYYSHVKVRIWDAKKEAFKKVPLAKLWHDHYDGVRLYERVVFRPQGAIKPTSFNLWRGLDVTPQPGDCSRYWDHVQRVICSGDTELFAYVKKWLAHSVQKTHELPETALVLRGLQGTGKGWFIRPLMEIFGSHALAVHNMEMVSGRFSGHLKDVVFLAADEAFWGGDKSREGLLKGLITERTRIVEPKHKDAHKVDNYVRLVVLTNNDWPVARDADDRRMCVLDVSPECKEDADYFGQLARQMQNGGTAALLHDLLAVDLAGWHPRDLPQRNTGYDIKLRSANPVVQWWYECLVEETNRRVEHGDGSHSRDWTPRPNIADLHDEYRHWCTRLNRKYVETREAWGREMRKMLPHMRIGRATDDGRKRQYVLGDLADCRRAFEVFLKCTADLWVDNPGDIVERAI